uniref:Uncharacterized protein n=1 Tax=Solanum lycopersicum TaxID=4081 RepID=A0A3Q7HNS0_SOLLC
MYGCVRLHQAPLLGLARRSRLYRRRLKSLVSQAELAVGACYLVNFTEHLF